VHVFTNPAGGSHMHGGDGYEITGREDDSSQGFKTDYKVKEGGLLRSCPRKRLRQGCEKR